MSLDCTNQLDSTNQREIEFQGTFTRGKKSFWDRVRGFFTEEVKPEVILPRPEEYPEEREWDGPSGLSVKGYFAPDGVDLLWKDSPPAGVFPLPYIQEVEFETEDNTGRIICLVERGSLSHKLTRTLGAGRGHLVFRHHGVRGDSVLLIKDITLKGLSWGLGVDDLLTEEEIRFSAVEIIPWEAL